MSCRLALGSLLAGLLLLVASRAQAQSDFVRIFDGQTFNGWYGDARYWTLENGVLRGKATTGLSGSTFLVWQGPPVEDFEFRLKFRIRAGNTGIQFRSVDLGGGVMAGYQADLAIGKDTKGQDIMGRIFDERIRKHTMVGSKPGKMVEVDAAGNQRDVGDTATAAELARIAAIGNPADANWHDYLIIARGKEITLMIDNVVTEKLTDHDPKAPRAGLFAFQIYRVADVDFRDIELKRIR